MELVILYPHQFLQNFEEATGGSEPSDTKPEEAEALEGMQEGEEEAKGSEEASAT